MAFDLDNIVPWGRRFDEYVRMFALDQKNLSGTILGCGDGPASFNAEALEKGYSVVSCDPIYRLSSEKIRERFYKVSPEILSQVERNHEAFAWDFFADVAELGAAREDAMLRFVADFGRDCPTHRYVDGALPRLPFSDNQFTLSLVSHLLFLYSEQLSLEFHLNSLRELMRVSSQLRVFPLTRLDGTLSEYLPAVMERLGSEYSCAVTKVDYEFQIGANEMLVIKKDC